jgi:CheY-like chemotaxis protein
MNTVGTQTKIEKKRILLVDDDSNITFLLRGIFERAREYDVRVVNVSARAVGVAKDFRPDLIILDVAMPGMDGGELASRLAEIPSLKSVPIIFLTASVTREEVSERDGLIGGLPFLAKPVDPAELLSCVRKRLGLKTSVKAWPGPFRGTQAPLSPDRTGMPCQLGVGCSPLGAVSNLGELPTVGLNE